jgi:hypothetical protein
MTRRSSLRAASWVIVGSAVAGTCTGPTDFAHFQTPEVRYVSSLRGSSLVIFADALRAPCTPGPKKLSEQF